MEKNNNWMEKLHKTEIKILDEFDRICKKNNLRYFLIGGTLIGAARHKGFIPWDDDIDLGMPRKDYKKFIKCCKKDLGPEYILDAHPVNKKCWHLFAKIRLKNTEYVETILNGLDVEHGIWIDIFPYDNINKFNSVGHKFKDKFRRNMLKLVKLKTGIKLFLSEFRKRHKIIMFFIDNLLKIVPTKVLVGIINFVISFNKNEKSKYCCCMTGSYSLERETQLRSDLFPTSEIEFEGKKYPCPKNYDQVLTKIYGDYMQIPPVEKRVTHNPARIVFEDGEVIEFKKDKK